MQQGRVAYLTARAVRILAGQAEQRATLTLARCAGATATLNRKDRGLVWSQALETGGVLFGDRVAIALDIEAIRPVHGKPEAGAAAVR